MMRMTFRAAISALVVGAALALSACGGDDDLTLVATADTTVPVTASSVGAITGDTFTFDSGVAALGTAGSSTAVTIGGTAAAPTFTVASGGSTASGTLGFGSCIFTVTSSNFPAGHPLAAGAAPIEVTPCSLTVGTNGKRADGSSSEVLFTFTLGSASAGKVKTVTIYADGTVKLGDLVLGTVTIVVRTGSGGG